MKKLIVLGFVFGCGGIEPREKTKVIRINETPTIVERQVDSEVTNFISKDQVIIDPPGLDNIDIGDIKCKLPQTRTINTTYVCVYGIKVEDENGDIHSKYYSCLMRGEDMDCDPVQLFIKQPEEENPRRRPR